ncbi:MAG: GAF domain-containing protein [Actinobacteria bacterium]|nr:GAF domain-containing protein [Actinomycetota bacterium]
MRQLKRFFKGIRGRILLVVLLVSTLTGVLVGVSAYYIARSSVRDQVYENLSNIADDVELVISDVWLPTLEGQMQILAGVAERLTDIYGGSEGISKGLEETGGKIPGFERLSVFLPNGLMLASSDPDYEPDRMEELETIAPGETIVIPYRLMEGSGGQEKVMTVAAPILMGGEVVGVLAGDVPPERLSNTLESLVVGSSGEVYIVNGESQAITLPPKAGDEAGLEILGEPMETESTRMVTEGESGVAEYTNYVGEEVLGSYIWMPELGWGLIVEESADVAFSRLSTLRDSVIVIVLILAVAALIASIFISRRISRPLIALKTGAEKLGLGDLDYRIDLKGAEELESMVGSFNRMAAAIQSSHEMMEQKVTESTRELRTMNEMISSLGRNMRPSEILQKALQLCLDFTTFDLGWCYLVGDEGWRLLYRRGPAGLEGVMPEAIRPREGLLGRIIERGEAVYWIATQDAAAEELSHILPEGSFVALPLRSPTRVLGLICLASQEKRRMSGDSMETLNAMADEVGIALENARLYMELQEHIVELERANRELRSLDEMKSNFISAVTHELKQPLALIGGYAQTIHDYYDNLTYEEEMHCLRVIMERTRFLSSLVEDLLDISMLEMSRIRLRLEELDLVALVRKAAEEHIRGGEEQFPIVDFPEDFPALTVDAKRIEQVLSNLFANAVKFSAGRGEIRITGRVKGDRVQVRVEDQGAGIDPSQLERIFDRFYQVDATPRRQYAGVGLGLFICRQLIEAHNGRIWAENRPEGGSVFIFELPLDAGSGGESEK